MERMPGLLGIDAFAGQRLGHLPSDGIDLVVTRGLVGLTVGVRQAGAGQASTRAFSALASSDGSGSGQGSFAACSASSMIAWITGWKLS